MPATAQEGLRGLANQNAIGVKDLNIAHDFVGSVFAHRYCHVRIFSHTRILTYNLT